MTKDTSALPLEETTNYASSRKVMDEYALRRVRKGKTAKDHASGAWRQRITNLEERAAWIHEITPKHYGSEASVPKMPKPHGLGNGAKRFKVQAGRRAKAS